MTQEESQQVEPLNLKKPFLIVLQNSQVIEEAEWKKIFALNIY